MMYHPNPESLAAKVVTFFLRRPDEYLTVPDVVDKFVMPGDHRNVHALLSPALDHELLLWSPKRAAYEPGPQLARTWTPDPDKHEFPEAFCLMWYGCSCGHVERIWNSRDGHAPFATLCPSCGKLSLDHIYWSRDSYAPNHTPGHGQRLWIDMTRERAAIVADALVISAQAAGRNADDVTSAMRNAAIEELFHDGEGADLAVAGHLAQGVSHAE